MYKRQILAVAAGMQPNLTFNPTEPGATITSYIVQVALGDLPHGSIGYQTIFAAGLTLLLMTLFFNLLGYWLRKHYREAVSYTHLDVYKRQGWECSARTSQGLLQLYYTAAGVDRGGGRSLKIGAGAPCVPGIPLGGQGTAVGSAATGTPAAASTGCQARTSSRRPSWCSTMAVQLLSLIHI